MTADTACPLCGYPFDIDPLGKHRCPNCLGEGLDDADPLDAMLSDRERLARVTEFRAEIARLNGLLQEAGGARDTAISGQAARGREIDHLKNIMALKDSDKKKLLDRAKKAEAVLREIISQIDQGGEFGTVFDRDNCIARAREIIKGAK
jgi:hypothetical protein